MMLGLPWPFDARGPEWKSGGTFCKAAQAVTIQSTRRDGGSTWQAEGIARALAHSWQQETRSPARHQC
jgi:hypothetical protein